MVALIAKSPKLSGRLFKQGMGNFLNPPTHPEHEWCVETDLRRKPENRGFISLSCAAKSDYICHAARVAAKAKLESWKPLPVADARVQVWIRQVLGYFANCYRAFNINLDSEQEWHASELVIYVTRDPLLYLDEHAGVHFIRTFYPKFAPTEQHFAEACWGTKP